MGRQRARAKLRGNWGQAVRTEGSVIGGQWLLYLAEWGLLLWCGLPIGGTLMESVDRGDYRGAWIRLAILGGILAADLLLLSPLKLGRSTFYIRMLSTTHPMESGHWRRYFQGKRYRQALGWRLHWWGRRLWWSLLLWSPAVGLMTVGEQLRLQAERGGERSLIPTLLLVCGGALLLVDELVVEILMMRYLPSARGIEQGLKVNAAYAQAKRIMKGHLDSLLWLYGRNLWRLCSCVLVFPTLYVMPLFRTELAYRLRRWAKMAAPIEKTTVVW